MPFKDVSTPISWIPVEILAIVFDEVLDITWFIDEKVTLPLQLGAVCRRWRKLVLTMSALWTHVSSPIHQEYLSRSKERLLTISLTYYHDHESTVTTELDALIPHVRRWSYLHIKVPQYPLLCYILAQMSDLHAPELQSLMLSTSSSTIAFPNPGNADYIVTSPPFFMAGAPRLRIVGLDEVPTPRQWFRSNQITEIRVKVSQQQQGMAEFHRTVASLPSLERISLEGSLYAEHADHLWTSVELANVRHLTIANIQDEENLCHVGAWLFTVFVMRSLESLTLEILTKLEMKTLVLELEARPPRFPAFQQLTLREVRCDIYERLFLVFPSIARINVDAFNDLPHVFPALQDGLCPQLSEIGLLSPIGYHLVEDHDDAELQLSLVLDLLDARTDDAGEYQIQTLWIDLALSDLLPDDKLALFEDKIDVKWFMYEDRDVRSCRIYA
ncbi:hypothetical protein PLICRDRAFT_39282 [Plicaturopsis crispa FD-325 SS-3]|nr:hypothetical protein PLICRDRAFT_39282 [Plicaturopsis crispa FD-325 SS-3]